jgi:hypothetical protein
LTSKVIGGLGFFCGGRPGGFVSGAARSRSLTASLVLLTVPGSMLGGWLMLAPAAPPPGAATPTAPSVGGGGAPLLALVAVARATGRALAVVEEETERDDEGAGVLLGSGGGTLPWPAARRPSLSSRRWMSSARRPLVARPRCLSSLLSSALFAES